LPFVVVVGQGYVGLPLAMRAVDVGHRVVGLDTDKARIQRLTDGDSFVEDIPSSQLASALATGRYTPTTDERLCEGFDFAIITVPTPLKEGIPDLSFIEDSGTMLARWLTSGATVVLESTTYPGTTAELLIPILEQGSGLSAGESFHVGYSPERIDPGNPKWGLVNTPKVVSGIDAASLAAVKGLNEG
jgi:nucleotide sugar dehydrogenase